MDTTDKLINTAKRLALQEMINKIKEEIEKLETSISNWEEIAEIQAEQIESDIKEKRVLEAVIRDLVKENKELKN